MKTIYRPTWTEINQDALIHNIDFFEKMNPNKIMIPVIKANAYGHGAINVMKVLYEKGIRYAAVSLLEEAMELRAAFDDLDILMLGPIMPDDLPVASMHRIEITVYDQMIYDAIMSSSDWLICHIKVDSGMSRYGFKKPNEVAKMVEGLQLANHVSLKGIYTHFATANDDEVFYQKQLSHFKKVLKAIKTKPLMIHISNSSSTLKYEKDYDFTTHYRLGISLYGLSLDQPKPDLMPVMSLKSKVAQIKELLPGDCVGYGATYCVSEPERIAILPIGYADGFLRRNKTGHVEIHGTKYKIVGIICMDACFIKVDETVHEGDTATLFGGIISADDVAKRLGTINYEVCTSISYRVPRRLTGGNHD